ncbi:MAG: hypothetical protein R2712_03675 [Vicinamibacterales bacterium]
MSTRRLLLIGHGRMGQLVETLAPGYGFELAGVLHGPDAARAIAEDDFGLVDVAIDFTVPDAVPVTMPALAGRGINTVIGTTGWQAHESTLRAVVADRNVGVVARRTLARHGPLPEGGRGSRPPASRSTTSSAPGLRSTTTKEGRAVRHGAGPADRHDGRRVRARHRRVVDAGRPHSGDAYDRVRWSVENHRHHTIASEADLRRARSRPRHG